MEKLFYSDTLDRRCRAVLDADGYLVLPGLLCSSTRLRLIESLMDIQKKMSNDLEHPPNHFAAEFNTYLASIIAHPQMLNLVKSILGESIRFDHCVTLNRIANDGGSRWHSHDYGEVNPELGFLRIFFYVNGFEKDDGGLKVVKGSHLYRDPKISADCDAKLEQGWMKDKIHPETRERLSIEALSVPPGSVILMWTHAAHAVSSRKPDSDTRWTVVYAYRNPGLPSGARWITDSFEKNVQPQASYLMPLY